VGGVSRGLWKGIGGRGRLSIWMKEAGRKEELRRWERREGREKERGKDKWDD
jgi:hypothetical protein